MALRDREPTVARSTMALPPRIAWLLALGLCWLAIGAFARPHEAVRTAPVVRLASASVDRALTAVGPSAPDSSIADEASIFAFTARLVSLDSVALPALSYRRNIVRSPLVPRVRPSPSLRS